MIVYTDLHSRTKNYSLPLWAVKLIESQYNVKITTDINSSAEIYWGDKLTDQHLKEMPNIKWIHLSKTGFGKFNLPANTLVTNTPESSEGVAEYATAAILYLLRGLNNMTLDRKSFDINIDNIKPFNEVNCLIVGHGRIGKEIDRLLTAIGMNVYVATKMTNNMTLDYDFIINALPLTEDTKNYFDSKKFGKMNKNSYIINVGRGETVNELDLIFAIENEIIKGAFLDVVQNEPIQKNNKLLKLKNVFISPHIANATRNSLDIQINAFKENLLRYKQGNELKNIIQGYDKK